MWKLLTQLNLPQPKAFVSILHSVLKYKLLRKTDAKEIFKPDALRQGERPGGQRLVYHLKPDIVVWS